MLYTIKGNGRHFFLTVVESPIFVGLPSVFTFLVIITNFSSTDVPTDVNEVSETYIYTSSKTIDDHKELNADAVTSVVLFRSFLKDEVEL